MSRCHIKHLGSIPLGLLGNGMKPHLALSRLQGQGRGDIRLPSPNGLSEGGSWGV